MKLFNFEITKTTQNNQRIKKNAEETNLYKQPVLQGNKSNTMTQKLATRKNIENYFSTGLSSVLPNPDPILKNLGRDQEAYEDILNDGALYQNLGSRKAGTLRRKWELEQQDCDDKTFELYISWFYNLQMHKLINSILNAPHFGYAIHEVVWYFDGTYYIPIIVEQKPNRWFMFAVEDNSLLIQTSETTDYRKVPDYKFIVTQYDASYDNPYGTPLLAKCYWNSIFRRQGKKFWITFVEKYGMPFLHGTFNADSLKNFYSVNDYLSAATLLKNDLDNMVGDGIIVNSEGINIEVISANAGSSDVYDRMLFNCKAENAETILGHTGTAMSTPGKLGSETAAMEVRQDIIDMDSVMVEQFFNTLIKWFAEINLGNVELPKFSFLQEGFSRVSIADETVKLTQTGIKFTEEYYKRKFNLDDGDFEIVEQSGVNQTAMAKAFARAHQLYPDMSANDIYEMLSLLMRE